MNYTEIIWKVGTIFKYFQVIKTNKFLLTYLSVLVMSLAYIMGQAVDVFLFHVGFDIHLPVMTMICMLCGLAFVVRKDLGLCFPHLRSLLFILLAWSVYLIINALMGASPTTSAILLFRFIGAWLIALEIAIFLHTYQERGRYTIGLALCISFLLITLIWYLQSGQSKYLDWLLPLLRDQSLLKQKANIRAQALYMNPNILGFVLVVHASLIIWYTFNKNYSMFVVLCVWLISFIGILKTGSRNALIGIVAVLVFGMFCYAGLYFKFLSSRTRIIIILSVFTVAGSQIYLFRNHLDRIQHTTAIVSSLDWSALNKEYLDRKLGEIDTARIQIWKHCWRLWQKKPCVGIGIGTFRYQIGAETFYHCHDFLLTTLVEQGILGVIFIIAFLSVLLMQMSQPWIGLGLLGCFSSTLIFDDKIWDFSLPVYASLTFGYCFFLVLSKKQPQA